MNFMDYLASLAPVGETLLVVKQKPTGDKYLDGTPRYVWPAMPPSQYSAGGAWYANTASFISQRMQTRLSASTANATHCLVMVLDDIGTKCKVPPLAPTWIMETSKDNFQYGYAFNEQPTIGDFSAAINAIAAAGFTDAGAINPVRNFRVPGSKNFKRGNFESVLAEFHPEREFTLPDICAALGVTPAAADTAQARAVNLMDNGDDDVLEWLDAHGLVLDAGNPQGWFSVRCPNSADHSDKNPSGRYAPLTRAYTCFHEHCGDWNSARFLDWVASQGGPKHAPGVRDTLLADVMSKALAKIKPSDMFSDNSDAVIADAEAREMTRVIASRWWERFAYVEDDDAYFDLVTRREMSRQTFNALYRHVDCRSIHTGRKIESSISFDEQREAHGSKTLNAITYSAGDDVLVSRDGGLLGNRWRNARPEHAPGDVTPWLEHCEQLIPDSIEREHCLDVMAHRVQFPEIKINHAVLHGGVEGCGKDTMWAPLLWAVCGPHMINRGIMDNDTVSSQWGYQLEAEILLINELREPDAAQRRAFANRLKPIIAAPPDYLPINRKGLHPYMMANRLLVLAFTNDPSPMSLASQDRRWFCIWSDTPRISPAKASKLWKWYATGGFQAVASWFYARQLMFDAKAAPPDTEFRLNLIEHGMSTAESMLVHMMRNRHGEFARGVIGAPFHDLCARASAHMPPGTKVPPAALFHALQEVGWRNLGRVASVEFTSKRHMYCAPELAGVSKSELRRNLEMPIKPSLSIVENRSQS